MADSQQPESGEHQKLLVIQSISLWREQAGFNLGRLRPGAPLQPSPTSELPVKKRGRRVPRYTGRPERSNLQLWELRAGRGLSRADIGSPAGPLHLTSEIKDQHAATAQITSRLSRREVR